jgi:ABC-type nitrate/sulfonate/bicarbonate transport system substrate-binding protein
MIIKLARSGILMLALCATVCTAAPAQTAPPTTINVAFIGVADAAPIVYAMQQGWFFRRAAAGATRR